MVEAVSRGVRAGRGLWIALALSLTLNVFALGGMVWPMVAGPPHAAPGGPVERLISDARTLDLTSDQQAALKAFGAATRTANRDLRESNAPLMRAMWDEMAKPQPDQASINAIFDQVLEHRRVNQRTITTNLMAFAATLTQEQRKRFAELALQRPGAQRPAADGQDNR